jgi:uncharacterized membrane protein
MSESLSTPVAHGLLHSSESVLVQGVEWLKLGVEGMGALIIAIGMVVAVIGFIRVMLGNGESDFPMVRLSLARYLALALEFQLAADILGTAISPGWDQIGQLGAIAVIRTALNYFLTREMTMEQASPHTAQS